MDRYRPRGRVDLDLSIEMGYGCRELYQKKWVKKKWVERERERERERESIIKGLVEEIIKKSRKLII